MLPNRDEACGGSIERCGPPPGGGFGPPGSGRRSFLYECFRTYYALYFRPLAGFPRVLPNRNEACGGSIERCGPPRGRGFDPPALRAGFSNGEQKQIAGSREASARRLQRSPIRKKLGPFGSESCNYNSFRPAAYALCTSHSSPCPPARRLPPAARRLPPAACHPPSSALCTPHPVLCPPPSAPRTPHSARTLTSAPRIPHPSPLTPHPAPRTLHFRLRTPFQPPSETLPAPASVPNGLSCGPEIALFSHAAADSCG